MLVFAESYPETGSLQECQNFNCKQISDKYIKPSQSMEKHHENISNPERNQNPNVLVRDLTSKNGSLCYTIYDDYIEVLQRVSNDTFEHRNTIKLVKQEGQIYFIPEHGQFVEHQVTQGIKKCICPVIDKRKS